MKRAILSGARVVAAALAVAVTVASTPPASAQSTLSSKQHFAAAQKLFDDQKYAEALPEFRAVLADSGSPNAHLYVARCLRELGDLAAAYEEMSATLRDARGKAETESKYVQTRDAAAAELAVLEGKIAKVIIAVADDASGAEITLNGQPVDPSRLGAPIAVLPGNVVVHATLEGHDPIDRQTSTQGGETRTITISLRPVDVATPAIVPTSNPDEKTPPVPPPPPEMTGGGVRTAGFVVGGIGVVGFGVLGVVGAMAATKYTSVKDACGGVRCNSTYTPAIDYGKELDTIANVGLVVGIVGVAGGVTMILLGGPKSAPPATVGLVSTPGGAKLGISGAF